MAKKTLLSTLKEMKSEDRKKLTHTLILTVSAAFLIVAVSLVFFSCKSDPNAYGSYTVPVDWVSIMKDSTWVVQSNNLDVEPFPVALRKLSKIVFLSQNGSTWTCRIETSTADTDECVVAMDSAASDSTKGSLTYVTTKLDVNLSESNDQYFMRLTGSGNRTCDLLLDR